MKSTADKATQSAARTPAAQTLLPQRADSQRAATGAAGVTQARLRQWSESSPKAAQLKQLGQTMQRAEDEELLQGRFTAVQRATEEEEPLQGRFATVQKADEEEPLQGRFTPAAPMQRQQEVSPNRTGLPDGLKAGIESLSGHSLDHVKVHYNSAQPAQLNALAYAQGSDIHVAPGQEQHLPHEAWHVVQQAQGRVQPTTQMAGVGVNDNQALESEADQMGARALAAGTQLKQEALQRKAAGTPVIQRFDAGVGAGWHIHYGEHIKYNSTNGTRVNFGGRSSKQIGEQIEEKVQSHGLAATKTGADFIECMTWIREHIKGA